MANISEIYNLNKNQYELDFINIDPDNDFPFYLNPFIFSSREDTFSIEATRTIKSFFQYNLELIDSGETEKARNNFSHLNEPNETCLGMSKGNPDGRGMGLENTNDIFESILNSEAIQSGLVDDLEDTAIFIDGIGKDKVSDMTTNIIRLNLIKYTQNQCNLHNIRMTRGISSGYFWDINSNKWKQEFTEMLIINNRKILLVPKGVVSYVKEFNHSKYHQHYALEFLQEDNLNRNTNLVKTTYDKNGHIKRRFVTKKSIIEHDFAQEKIKLVDFTNKHPLVFKKFKEETAKQVVSLSNSEFNGVDLNGIIDYLIVELKSTQPGNVDATKYHRIMIGILELIFYPKLINPIKEKEINEGRKRIDICFDNAGAKDGFFHRLQHVWNIPCQYIFFECKNYSDDIENPELDQMVGRLSPNRGKFGVILCRKIENINLFISRCKDSYISDHGLIIPITDIDIIKILEEMKKGNDFVEIVLSDKARIIMN